MKLKVEIEGLDELIEKIKQLEKFPQTSVVTKGVKAGAKMIQNRARTNAPYETGALRRGISLKAEKSKKKGKKAYQVRMNPKMNDTFVKISKSGSRGYYPASMEFGFITRKGNKFYPPEVRYMAAALNTEKTSAEKALVDTLKTEVEKIVKG